MDSQSASWMVDVAGLPWPGCGTGGQDDATPDGGSGLLWAALGPGRLRRPGAPSGLAAGEAAATTTTTARPQAAPVKQRDSHLSGRHVNLAVYYLRTFEGRRYLAPEWHPVPYTRAVAVAAVTELLDGEPYCPGSRRPFPAGARLHGVQIDKGTATVELSGTGLPASRARPGAGRSRPWSTP